MRFNWKVLIALVVLVAVLFWGVDSLRTRWYSGTDLDFGVGSGPVTITNSTDASVPVQLVSTGTRTFTVSSTADGVLGTSERQGSGRTITQLFAFDLPPGITELLVGAHTSAVSFVTGAAPRLDASVQPLAASDAKTTTIVAGVVILGTLFYISKATDHRWLKLIRRKQATVQVQKTEPHATGSSVGDSYLD
jgi:hypothetical protein